MKELIVLIVLVLLLVAAAAVMEALDKTLRKFKDKEDEETRTYRDNH